MKQFYCRGKKGACDHNNGCTQACEFFDGSGGFNYDGTELVIVRKGQWKRGGYACGDYEWTCSECGESFWQGVGWPDKANYCPSCGARMDEKDFESEHTKDTAEQITTFDSSTACGGTFHSQGRIEEVGTWT